MDQQAIVRYVRIYAIIAKDTAQYSDTPSGVGRCNLDTASPTFKRGKLYT